MKQANLARIMLALLFLAILTACSGNEPEQQVTPAPATATPDTASSMPTSAPLSETFVTVATSAPYPPFEYFDDYGTVVGFDADTLAHVMEQAGYDYEFVVTNFDGMLDSVATGEFDMAVSPLITGEGRPGIAYTTPYLEVAQVLVVLANERDINSYHNLTPGTLVGVVANSFGQQAALDAVGLLETDLKFYDTPAGALQALIDSEVRGVIVDHDDAEQFTETYFQQLKIAGGPDTAAWITSQQYVMAVDADQEELLAALNTAIAEMHADGTAERLMRNWLVSKEVLNAGESLVGTPDDVLVIGTMGQLGGIDPLDGPGALSWEVKRNTMSGLVMYDADGNLVPVLAAGMPQVSADGLEYTFGLRPGLVFPDGSPLIAEDVKWSIERAAAGGNWHVNAFLKDSDANGIADSDAVQVLAPDQVKIVLKEPASYFLSLLATPPYYVASQACYAATENAARNCSGIAPYEVVEWEQDDRLLMRKNTGWPAEFPQPAIDNVQIRFYSDAEQLRNAVQIEAVDMAWSGLPESTRQELEAVTGLQAWEGPANFKSYLVFEQSTEPWNTAIAREAVAYALDREALARDVFDGERRPLYSPVPDDVPGHVATLPARDLGEAREQLGVLGYSEDTPLEITLWYLNDGRYTPLEEAYAQAIKEQLEETGVIQVTLQGAPWEVYSLGMTACEYGLFMLGWPPVGWPSRFPAAMGWMEYFVTNTDSLCSNYTSPEMDELIANLRTIDPLDVEGQLAAYAEMQTLWAEEFPTLELTQQSPVAVGWEKVGNVRFDNMGLLLYDQLTKVPSPEEDS